MTKRTAWYLVLIVLCLVVLSACTNHEKQCRIAQMKVEHYESCARKVECQLTEFERGKLVWAKTDVIKWCER